MRVNVRVEEFKISDYVEQIRKNDYLRENLLNRLCYKSPKVLLKTEKETFYELYYDYDNEVFTCLKVWEADTDYIHELEDTVIFIYVSGNGINPRVFKIFGKSTRFIDFNSPTVQYWNGTWYEIVEITKEELAELKKKRLV
jgi:hypothetical protein